MKTKDKPRILCRCCGGSGEIEMPEEYVETLCLAQRNAQIGLTAEQAAGILDTKVTTQSMRLKRLMDMGYLNRKRDGKYWIYRPA